MGWILSAHLLSIPILLMISSAKKLLEAQAYSGAHTMNGKHVAIDYGDSCGRYR